MKDTFVCDCSIIFYSSRNPSGQQKKAFSIQEFFLFFFSISFFQMFAYPISHPSPPFSHYLCAQQDANNNIGNVFCFLGFKFIFV